jgi:uncharacterized membrane protein YbhN (UPF0104 family)
LDGRSAMRWKLLGKWVLAVALFGVVFLLGDVRELAHLRVAWTYVPGILFSTVAFILLHALRWKRVVDAMAETEKTRFFPFYRWMIHGYTLGYIMPTEVSLLSVRTYYLNRYHNLSLPAALFSVIVDRLLDLIVFLIVVIPSFLFLLKFLPPAESLILIAVLVGGFLVITRWKGEDGFNLLIRFYRRLLTVPFLRKRMRVDPAGVSWECSLGKGGFYSVSLWTVGAYLLLVLRIFSTGQALHVNLTLLQCLFIIPVIQISGLIGITPANLGFLELGSWGALLLVNVPKEQILQFVLGQRILLTAVMLFLILSNHLLFLLRGRWAWLRERS